MNVLSTAITDLVNITEPWMVVPASIGTDIAIPNNIMVAWMKMLATVNTDMLISHIGFVRIW